jgi:thiosulfate/3-mercaptopyruvate sulfurtransferase
MSATIFIPTPLRKLTGGQTKIQIDASTLQEAIDHADEAYPGFRERVLDSDGQVKRFINVFVNGVDVRKLQGRETPVKDGDEVAVIPAMAGGEGDDSPPDAIVGVEWLAKRLNDPGIRILDVRVSDPRLPIGYRMGHVPNALSFDLHEDVYEMGYGLPKMKSVEAIAQALGSRGVSSGSKLIVYDENIGPLAAFVYWLLKYLGHSDVYVLNGGWHAWQKAKAPITGDVPQFQPCPYVAHVDGNQRSTADWIQEHSQAGDLVLLDARSDGEYYMGHIPRAVNLSFDAAIDYSNQMLKDKEELKKQFEAVGITPDRDIVTYCGSGSRSAHTYLVLKLLGYPRVRNYDGSMMDWVQTRRLPVE